MSASLHIRLLGDWRLTYDGDVVTTVHSERLRSLLGYVALRCGVPQPRRRIAFSLWPDSREHQAMSNLRNLLFRLRDALPEADRFLDVDANSICWKADGTSRVDAVDFQRALDRARESADEERLRALREAAHLYRGPLLDGCYDEWIFPERQRLHQACVAALEELVEILEAGREYRAAIAHAQRLLQLDPDRETTYRWLMRLHALNDDRSGAARVFETCKNHLQQEFGLEPDPATKAIYDQIRRGEHSVSSTDAPSDDIALVGRREEWNGLRAEWRSTVDGRRARFVVLNGEAGIGKTRLSDELLSWCDRQGFDTARARCYAAEGRLAFAPVVEWMRSDALTRRTALLEDVWRRELARLLPELRVKHVGNPSRDESWTRQRLFDALARSVTAGDQPVLLVLDDLQWSDIDTLEWLRFLMRRAIDSPVLLVCTFRADEAGPDHPVQRLFRDLSRTEQITTLEIAPLSIAKTAQLAGCIAERPLDAASRDCLYRETEGNPLFVVETVRAGFDVDLDGDLEIVRGMAVPQRRDLPGRVHAVIEGRLERLSPPARSVAALASVCGRSFTFDLLAGAGNLSEEPLLEALDELWESRIITEYGDGTYDFTHDKLREVAYGGISPVRRRLLHRRIAEALADRRDYVTAHVAAHFDLAGLRDEAASWYDKAAADAERVGSYHETAQLLRRAAALLEEAASGADRDRRLLNVLVRLGLATRFSEGHAAEPVGRVFERAQALAQAAGEPSDLFTIQRGLWSFHLLRGEYAVAVERGQALMSVAEDAGDDGLRLEAYVALALTRLWQGRLDEAVELLRRSLQLYDADRHGAHTLRFGQDPGVAAHSLLGYAYAHLGDDERAASHLKQAFYLAEQMDHPFSRAYALQHAMLVEHVTGRPEGVKRHAKVLLELSEERGFAYWIGPARIGQGWARSMTDRTSGGIALIRRGIAEHREKGAALSSTLWLGMLADALAENGETDEAVECIDEALSLASEMGEGIWMPHLLRLREAIRAEA